MSQTTMTIVGNLTRDPEVRFIPSGTAVTNFGVAHTPRRNVDGKWEDGEPEYYDVEAWGKLAENIGDTFTQGMRVVLVGRLRFSKWEDKETGGNRSKVSVVAEFAGPDLTWATATVSKNEKGGGGGGAKPRPSNRNPFDEDPIGEEQF